MTTRPSLADSCCVVLLFALCLAIGLPRYRIGMDPSDEGFLAYGAVRVMEGQVPNRDFVSLQPPLSFYTVAAVFKILGTSLLSLRILGLAIHLLLPALAYGIARHLLTPAWAFTAALPATLIGIPFFGFVPFAVWQGVTASALAAFFYLHAARSARPTPLAIAAGLMTAASLLCRQDQGVYLGLAIVVYTLALKRFPPNPRPAAAPGRFFISWIAGILLGIVPAGLYWGVRGAWPEMFRQLVLFPVTTYAKTSSLPFPRFSSTMSFTENATLILFYIPPAIGLLVAAQLWRRFRRHAFGAFEVNVTFLLAWSALFYLQVLTRSDLYHLLVALIPAFILFACFLRMTWDWLTVVSRARSPDSSRSLVLRNVVSTVAAAVLLWFLWLTGSFLLLNMPGSPGAMLQHPRGGVTAPPGLDNLIRDVQHNAPADRSILSLPYEPIYYFLCERRNPTHWNYLWPGDQSPADHLALIQQAKRDPPAVVLLTGENDMAKYAPAIVDYIHAEYRKAADLGVLSIYVPK